ncbi:MAG: YncE family protein [Gemmatimonadota bacterium]|nr:YncE family protein [Gemmatimonadota bacterium]
MRLKQTIIACLALGAAVARAQAPAAAPLPDKDYLVYVASEATDKIALLRFGPKGAKIDKEFITGLMPADVDGPHGLAVSPDGKYFYVSTAHGTPYGSLWKYVAGTDSLLGRVELGNFPATAQVTPDGEFIYVVNFNLHGDMVPSSVSIVATDAMLEVARVTTCTMPHGSRLNVQGTKQYSACMMDDMIAEIDTRTFGVARHFMLKKGSEHGMAGAPKVGGMTRDAHADMGGHGMEAPKPGDVSCSPTWAQPSADGKKVFVACNKSSDIAEVDVATWTLTRRIPAGDGVYNLAVTHDGTKLIGTNKRGQSVSVIDIASGKELARIPTKRKVVHGAVVSPDDRYVFISVEGIGSQPGTVEMIDLVRLKTVATVDVGQQAGGIDFWKIESPAGK